MKYFGIAILLWGSCIIVFAIANLGLYALAGVPAGWGSVIRCMVGIVIAGVGGLLFEKGGGRLPGNRGDGGGKIKGVGLGYQ